VAVPRGLRRLLEVRELEEELKKAALEEALSDLRLLRAALEEARERERSGRRRVTASAASRDVADRIAGLEETRAAGRYAAALAPRIAGKEREVASWRQEYLAKRMERRQVETLIRKAEAAAGVIAGRRGQRQLDDWFLDRAGQGNGARERK